MLADVSPLENHHLSEAFKIMRRRDYDFLRRMSREKQVGYLERLCP